MSTLLCDFFDVEALRAFLKRHAGGLAVLMNTREGLSPVGLMDAIAESLDQRGMIDQVLFQGLAAEFPQRADELWRRAARLGIESPLMAGEDIVGPAVEDGPASPVARLLAPSQVPSISPSRFFDLQREVDGLVRGMDELGRRSGVESVHVVLESTRRRLRTVAYTVALIGPQRAGKSTLANALIGAEISPVADYPTTAVPLLFMSGDRPEATIYYEDGSACAAEATVSALHPYAAHHVNDGHAKGIRLIQVRLPNPTLAKGLALIDLPGLRDSSVRVQVVTKQALATADAVLYVMDASLDRKFAINASMLEDLQVLVASKERVLVVLTQADDLAEGRRAALREYVEMELGKYGLRELLAAPPMFVSGREGYLCRSRGRALPECFLALEEALWGHLLKMRATGLHRLAEAVRALGVASDECVDLLDDRSKRGVEATDVAHARTGWRTALGAVERAVGAWRSETSGRTHKFMYEQVAGIRGSFEQTVAHAPNNQLPTPQDVSRLVQGQFSLLAQQTVAIVDEQMGPLSEQVSAIAGHTLDASRALMGLPARAAALSALGRLPEFSYTGPPPDLGFFGGLLGFLVNPFVGLATLFLGVTWAENQTRRRIEGHRRKLREGFAEYVTGAEGQLVAYAQDYIRVRSGELQQEVSVRLDTFIKDGERRLERLGKPLDQDEADRLEQVKEAIGALRARLRDVEAELQPLLDMLG